MKHKSGLNLNIEKSMSYIDAIATEIRETYGIDVEYGENLSIGDGYIRDGIYGDLSIYIGSNFKTIGSIFKKVDDIDFLKCICALYHEEQHILQNTITYMDKNPTEDAIMMATRKIASSENKVYYMSKDRYLNDLSEIKAESIAIINTHNFIQKHFNNANAELLICKLVNQKIIDTNNGYYIQGHYESLDEIIDAFSNHYEQAKNAKVRYTIPELRPSQEIDSEKDECVRFLQTCVKNDTTDRILLTKFNSTREVSEKDLMIASITQHLHPDIDFKKVYPCLQDIDLEPEIIFGQRLQNIMIKNISKTEKEEFEYRVEKAKEVKNIINEKQLKEQLHKNDMTEELNTSLLAEKSKDKINTYEP